MRERHHLLDCQVKPRPTAWPRGRQAYCGSNAGGLHCPVLQRMQFWTPIGRNQVGHVLYKSCRVKIGAPRYNTVDLQIGRCIMIE